MLSRASPARTYRFLSLSAYTRKLASWVQPSVEDLDTCTSFLRSCNTLSHGEHVHLHLACYGYDTIPSIQNVLLHMYSKCGSLCGTRTFFAKMHNLDVFSWNIIINAHARHGNIQCAFEIFQQMLWDKVDPNQFTFVSILSVCIEKSVLVVGEYMHACVVMDGWDGDVVVDTAIVNMYSKCSDLNAAAVMFEMMKSPNVYSWSAMIAAYAQHRQGEDAIRIFHVMQHQAHLPNNVTFISLLDACACLGAINFGTRLRASITGTEIDCDVVVATAFVNMYAKCNHVKEAREVFNKLTNPNVVSWNAMISAHAQHGEGMEALKLFRRMQGERCEPDRATFVAVLDACTGSLALKVGEDVHAQIVACCLLPDVVLSTASVNMYGKCGSLGRACEVFEEMPCKNIVTWNAIIAVHAQHGYSYKAFEYFHQMHWEGVIPDKITFVSIFDGCAKLLVLAEGKHRHTQIITKGSELDITVGTAIINMYGKCGDTEAARNVFDKLPEKNTITWSSMIGAYAQLEQGDDAFRLYSRMHQEGMKPDLVSCISVLDVCASTAALVEGELVHIEVVIEAYEVDEAVGTALVSLYGRCGCLEAACAVFFKMPSQSVVAWNALIACFAQHGLGKETLQLFYQMQDMGLWPTDVTFISVLNACSHAGLVKEGRYCFYLMSQKYGIAPCTEHYGCMVDMLGRAGLLDEAEGLICDMPELPTIVTWMSLLGACRHQTDVKRGERAAITLFQLDPENIAPRVMLSNMYAVISIEEEAACLMTEEDTLEQVASML